MTHQQLEALATQTAENILKKDYHYPFSNPELHDVERVAQDILGALQTALTDARQQIVVAEVCKNSGCQCL